MTTMLTTTREYLERLVTASVDLAIQPVSFSLDGGDTWLTGEWQGSSATVVQKVVSGVTITQYQRVAQVLLGDTNAIPAVGEYAVLVKIVDDPEQVVMAAGALVVEAP